MISANIEGGGGYCKKRKEKNCEEKGIRGEIERTRENEVKTINKKAKKSETVHEELKNWRICT